MSEKLELMDGAWAEVLDDDEVARIPNRERRRIMAAWAKADGTNTEKGMALTDALVGLIVVAWSYPYPPPGENLAMLEDLPGHDYDVLAHRALEVQTKLYKSFNLSPDPKVPTGNSSG